MNSQRIALGLWQGAVIEMTRSRRDVNVIAHDGGLHGRPNCQRAHCWSMAVPPCVPPTPQMPFYPRCEDTLMPGQGWTFRLPRISRLPRIPSMLSRISFIATSSAAIAAASKWELCEGICKILPPALSLESIIKHSLLSWNHCNYNWQPTTTVEFIFWYNTNIWHESSPDVNAVKVDI